PKDGGNIVKASFLAEGMKNSMQGDNLTDALRARGLSRSNTMDKIYDVGGSLGGPIIRDKLWFFTAARGWGSKENLAGVYFNATQNTLFYTSDLNRPAYYDRYVRDAALRLTWQATS